MSALDFDPYAWDFHEDPFPTYRWLRDEALLERELGRDVDQMLAARLPAEPRVSGGTPDAHDASLARKRCRPPGVGEAGSRAGGGYVSVYV